MAGLCREACKQAGISDKRYYRWRKIYGDLKVDQARKFQAIEAENDRIEKLVDIMKKPQDCKIIAISTFLSLSLNHHFNPLSAHLTEEPIFNQTKRRILTFSKSNKYHNSIASCFRIYSLTS